MRRTTGGRYFDLSAMLTLALTAFLLVSLPGGCWDDSDENEEDLDESASMDATAEPTEQQMMEIVELDPGDIDTGPQPDDGDAAPETASDEAEGEPESEGEAGESPDGEAEQAGNDASEGVYVVQQGDTLYGIAVQLGVSMDQLMEANGMSDPNQLQVGQELQVP